ncbi:unnamed protein product, partial [Protopolystoma xenopodis]
MSGPQSLLTSWLPGYLAAAATAGSTSVGVDSTAGFSSPASAAPYLLSSALLPGLVDSGEAISGPACAPSYRAAYLGFPESSATGLSGLKTTCLPPTHLLGQPQLGQSVCPTVTGQSFLPVGDVHLGTGTPADLAELNLSLGLGLGLLPSTADLSGLFFEPSNPPTGPSGPGLSLLPLPGCPA